MDLKTLKAEFGDKIVFNGAIDSVDMMPGGGYIAGASHDTILEETPVENILAMFDSVHEFGVY